MNQEDLLKNKLKRKHKKLASIRRKLIKMLDKGIRRRSVDRLKSKFGTETYYYNEIKKELNELQG